jgi:L-threonate 2-dehydrogenase
MARLAEAGGIATVSPRDVAEKAEVLITSLPNVDAFEQVMAGQGGIASSNGTGQIVIECSTLPIEVKARGQAQLAVQGKTLLDCPVSGTGAQAATKDLVVFASGDEAAFVRCREVLAGISRAQKYVGAFGNGSRMKYVANLLVAIHNVASAEAMVLGMKAGLPPKLIFDLVKTGAGNSRIFELRAPMMVKNSYGNPTMKISVWQKDMDVIGSYARKIAVPTPMFDASKTIYAKALRSGHSAEDTAAVCAVLEKMAGVKRTKGRGKAA